MLYKKLGNTNLKVSLLCLGTMSFGEQNTEKDTSEYSLPRAAKVLEEAFELRVKNKKEWLVFYSIIKCDQIWSNIWSNFIKFDQLLS